MTPDPLAVNPPNASNELPTNNSLPDTPLTRHLEPRHAPSIHPSPSSSPTLSRPATMGQSAAQENRASTPTTESHTEKENQPTTTAEDDGTPESRTGRFTEAQCIAAMHIFLHRLSEIRAEERKAQVEKENTAMIESQRLSHTVEQLEGKLCALQQQLDEERGKRHLLEALGLSRVGILEDICKEIKEQVRRNTEEIGKLKQGQKEVNREPKM
ncbi:hypothetical protein BJY04DRAFT_214735 [Aspergillus karnatakaensis]|uniref:uncharacterized protein n=1 Tax=Aspergillus karnatakaensis TaxID=1810916 RepID=UPI003CCE2AA7